MNCSHRIRGQIPSVRINETAETSDRDFPCDFDWFHFDRNGQFHGCPLGRLDYPPESCVNHFAHADCKSGH
jgi:hypothetical protein